MIPTVALPRLVSAIPKEWIWTHCQAPAPASNVTTPAWTRITDLPLPTFTRLPIPAINSPHKAISSNFSPLRSSSPGLCQAHGFLCHLDAENFQMCSRAALDHEMLIKHSAEMFWEQLCFFVYWCAHVRWRYISGDIVNSFQDIKGFFLVSFLGILVLGDQVLFTAP